MNRILLKDVLRKRADLSNLKSFSNSLDKFSERSIFLENGKQIEEYKAITYRDKIITIVSKRYNLLNHKDVFNSAIEILEKEKSDVKGWIYVTNDYKNAYMYVSMEKDIILDLDDSLIDFGFLITNSVDKTTAIKFNFFAIREVCTNGMLGKENIYMIKMLHTREVSSILGNVKESVYYIVKNYTKIKNEFVEYFRELSSISIEKQKCLEISKKVFENKKAIAMIRNIINQKPEARIDGYDLYNIFTYVISNVMKIKINNSISLLRKVSEILSVLPKS